MLAIKMGTAFGFKYHYLTAIGWGPLRVIVEMLKDFWAKDQYRTISKRRTIVVLKINKAIGFKWHYETLPSTVLLWLCKCRRHLVRNICLNRTGDAGVLPRYKCRRYMATKINLELSANAGRLRRYKSKYYSCNDLRSLQE